MSRRPYDDAAQVVLRALLAWPLLGAIAAIVLRTGDDGPVGLVFFGVGAGFGAALMIAAAEVVLLLGLDRPRAVRLLALAGALLVLALLAPALLLGGEFGAQLLERRSSVKATLTLLARHRADPASLLDLDAALSVLLVGAALLVGRARGLTAQAQSAAGAWLVLIGAAARLGAGRLEAVELRWVLLVEVGLALLAPHQVALADLAVRGARRLLVRRARPARVAGVLGLTLAPCVVAVAWALALDRASFRLPSLLPLRSAEAAWAGGLVLAAVAALAVAHRRGASRRALLLAAAVGTGLPTAVVGRDHPWLALTFVGAALVVATLLPAAALLLLRTRGVAGALVPRRVPVRRRAAIGLALLLAPCLALAAATRRQGASARARVGLLLGLDPVRLLRRAEGANERLKAARTLGWGRALSELRLAGGEHDSFRPLQLAAAERGDRRSIVELADTTVVPVARLEAWLVPLAAGGDLEAARHLVRRADDDATRERAVAALFEAARRGEPGAGQGLATVWEESADHRAEVEELLVASPEPWSGVLDAILLGRGVVRPGRPFLRKAAANHRAAPITSEQDAELLEHVLRLDPSLLELGDVERVGEAHYFARCPVGWSQPLAGLDLRPLAPRGPALEAAARGEWDAAWALATVALLEDPTDRDALRTRAHALLARARGDLAPPPDPPPPLQPGPPELYSLVALTLADATLAALGLPADAAGALDRVVCDLHRLVGLDSTPGDAAALLAWLDAAPHLAEPSRRDEVTARVAVLRGAALGAMARGATSTVDANHIREARAALEHQLEQDASGRPDELARRRTAAVALRAAR